MPPLPSEWLRDIRLAEFTPSAISDIDVYAHEWSVLRGAESNQQNSFQAFIELGAIEFALTPLYRGSLTLDKGGKILENVPSPNQVIFPVHITDSVAADAIYKTDCGPFMEHSLKEEGELRPWDVFAFAGDMSKVELLGYSDNINALADPANMQALLEQLAERYRGAGLGDRIVESGLLAAQGLVWSAKLALLRGEDYTETRGLPFVARYLPGPAIA